MPTIISSKSYANAVTDNLDDDCYKFLFKCYRDFVDGHAKFDDMMDDDLFLDTAHEIVRETVVPFLEQKGFDLRPDGCDF